MDFFLEVGVYVLMVALAAGGAAFVVFRLLTSSRDRRRPAFAASGRKDAHMDEDGDGFEEQNAPAPAPRKVQPPRQEPVVKEQQQVAAIAETPVADSAVTESVQPSSASGANQSDGGPDAREGAASGEPANESPGPASSELPVDVATEDSSTEFGDLSEDSNVEPGTIQKVVAPPQERDEDGDDSFMAMFQGNDDDDNSMESLAGAVEDVTAADLLSEALELTATMKTWGGEDA